jgi:hypothetical protein
LLGLAATKASWSTRPIPILRILTQSTLGSPTASSIVGAPDSWNSNADQNCLVNPLGAQPDASNSVAGSVSPTVNNNHCGK